MASPDSSRDGGAGSSGGSAVAAAENGVAPSEPEEIAAVLEGLAADRERTASGGAADIRETDTSPSPDRSRLKEAAEAAMQRGDLVFGFPESECCARLRTHNPQNVKISEHMYLGFLDCDIAA